MQKQHTSDAEAAEAAEAAGGGGGSPLADRVTEAADFFA
jgi:hypothetical protein